MDFGHVADPDRVDLTLPPDHPITAGTLARLPTPTGPARIHCGLPVWKRRDWVGPFYPPDTQPDDYLAAYARGLDMIEVNSSFHHPPPPDVVHKWLAAVPPHFRFVLKVWKHITHDPPLRPAEVEEMLISAQAFGDRLSLCFAQLPPHAGLGWRRPLAQLLDALAPHVPLAIELRHPDWFRVEPTRTRLLDHLAERGVGLVITDTPGHRELVHQAITASPLLIRFRGEDLHPTDFTRIDAWAKRLDAWFAQGLREVYFAAHQSNHHEIDGLPLLARLADRFAGRTDVVIVPPLRGAVPAEETPQLGLSL